MEGPMDEGSSSLTSIMTRPIRVPIMPQAGPRSPIFSRIFTDSLARSTVASVSMVRRDWTSGDLYPSATS